MNLRPSLAFLAASVFHLTLLPSAMSFSARLRVVVNNETKIDTSFGSSDPNTAPIEVESWTEALTSPKVKEAGTSFIVLRGRDDGAEATSDSCSLGSILKDSADLKQVKSYQRKNIGWRRIISPRPVTCPKK